MNDRRLFLATAAAVAALFVAGVLPVAAPPEVAAAARNGAPPAEIGRITLAELKALLARREPVTIIDVRGDSATKIKGALHIPLPEIEARLKEIPRDREIVTYCA